MVARDNASSGSIWVDWCIAIGVLCFSVLASGLSVLERLDLQWLDTGFALVRHLRPPEPASDIVIVGFDAASLEHFDKPFALIHEEIALILDALRLAPARGVAVDMVFTRQDYSRLMPGSTTRLANAIQELRSTVPLVIGALTPIDKMTLRAERIYAAMAGVDGTASMQVTADLDGALRRLDDQPGAQMGGQLAASLVRKLGQPTANGMVDFSIGAPFSYIPAELVVRLAQGADRAALARMFHGRIVLVGSILSDQDRQRIPARLAAWEPAKAVSGVVFQAQAVRSLMQRRMIENHPWLGHGLALMSIITLWLSRNRLLAVNFLGLVAGLACLALSVVTLANGHHVTVISPMLAIIIGLACINGRALAFNQKERRRVQGIFAGYVSPAILDAILGGELQNGRISRHQLGFLFADIRGFTAYSAIWPPERVITFLNRYYTIMTEVLHRHNGTVDKFSGDGVMVFFGAPQPSANPSRDAILAGCAMLEALDLFNAELQAAGAEAIGIRIGIAFGDAVIGNVGSTRRHDYTATGAATNLAAHIQQYCKVVQFTLLVEEDTLMRAALAPEMVDRFERLGAVNLDKHGAIGLAGLRQKGAHGG